MAVGPREQQNHSIQAFTKCELKFLNARLWGTLTVILKAIKTTGSRCGIEWRISFKGYTTDVNAVYNRAQLACRQAALRIFFDVVGSPVPRCSDDCNDVKYGPSDIIQDGVMVLMEDGKPEQLAEAMIKLLDDQSLLNQYSDAAYENAKRYSEDTVFEKWQRLLDYFG